MTEVSSINSKAEFRTKDLNQAAFIWCQEGSRLVRLQGQGTKDKNTTIYFLFELEITQEDLHKLQLDYANGETTVEPCKFVEKQNKLRDLLHSSLGISSSRK